MKFNTAFATMLLGVSIVLAIRNKIILSGLLGLVILVFCLLTMIEYFYDLNIHIDELFIIDYLTNAQIEAPGRISLYSTIAFFIITLGLELALLKKYSWSQNISSIRLLIDLKTPIAALRASIEMMERRLSTQLQEKDLQLLAIPKRSVDRLYEMIQQLGKNIKTDQILDYNVETIDLCNLVKEIIIELQHTILATKTQVNIDIPDCEISYERIHLQSIIQNLITNAVKFRHPVSEEGRGTTFTVFIPAVVHR
jgi:signal transduction histidine kinase